MSRPLTAGRFSGFAASARVASVYLLVGTMLVFARPDPTGVALGALWMLCGELLRLWAAGHLIKNETLVTSGPYRYTRNPLYLGRLTIFIGLCLMARLPYAAHWVVLLAGIAVFFGYYLPRKERVEPARLRAGAGRYAELDRWPSIPLHQSGWWLSSTRFQRQ